MRSYGKSLAIEHGRWRYAAFSAARCILPILFLPSLLQAQPKSSDCGPETLDKARGSLTADNLVEAEHWARMAQNCPGEVGKEAQELLGVISRRRNSDQLMIDAQAALINGDRELACKLALQIEDTDPHYKNIADLKRDLGDCDREREKLKVEIEDALAKLKAGDPTKARSLLDQNQGAEFPELQDLRTKLEESAEDRLSREYYLAQTDLQRNDPASARRRLRAIIGERPSYRDAKALLRLAENQLASRAAAAKSSEALDTAAELYEQRRLGDALRAINEALNQKPSNAAALDLRQDIQLQMTKDRQEAQRALEAFYSGEYSRSRDLWEHFRRDPRPPRAIAASYFYQAVSVAAEMVLAGESELDYARRLLVEASKTDPGFQPPWEMISPRIREMLLPGNQ